MKNIAIIAIILVAAYFTIQNLAFKKDILFDGEIYSHVKEMSGGDLTNHFYTIDGEDFALAKNFIQIIEVSDNIPKSMWADSFSPLYSQYKLQSIEGEEFELAGEFKKSGLNLRSYATLITVKGNDHMAFYVAMVDDNAMSESISKKIDVIHSLKEIAQHFD